MADEGLTDVPKLRDDALAFLHAIRPSGRSDWPCKTWQHQPSLRPPQPAEWLRRARSPTATPSSRCCPRASSP